MAQPTDIRSPSPILSPLEEELSWRASTPKTTLTRSISNSRLEDLSKYCGVFSTQGCRAEMEDAHSLDRRKISKPPQTTGGGDFEAGEPGGESHGDLCFFGVFDGHGGRRAADYAQEHLCEQLSKHPKLFEEPQTALAESFDAVEAAWTVEALANDWMDGTTAAVAAIVDRKLVVGNVGDSELVLACEGTAIPLAAVHNMKKNPEEIARVSAAGGKVYNNRVGHPKFNPAVISLGVSRAIGDIAFKHEKFTNGKESGLVATPEVAVREFSGKEEFLIIGCDGLWDVVSHQQAVDVAAESLKKGSNVDQVSKELGDLALQLGSRDNITVMILLLDGVRGLPPLESPTMPPSLLLGEAVGEKKAVEPAAEGTREAGAPPPGDAKVDDPAGPAGGN